jgi:hypothetical protein
MGPETKIQTRLVCMKILFKLLKRCDTWKNPHNLQKPHNTRNDEKCHGSWVVGNYRSQWHQELWRQCVLTTSRQSLLKRHVSWRTAQTRYGLHQLVKIPSHWYLNESENVILSGDVFVFLMYVHKFICLHTFLFIYVCLWHTPITSWTTISWRPSLLTRVSETCVSVHETRWYTSVSEECAHTWNKIFSCVRVQETQWHNWTKTLFGFVWPPTGTGTFNTPRNMTGLSVSETVVSVN